MSVNYLVCFLLHACKRNIYHIFFGKYSKYSLYLLSFRSVGKDHASKRRNRQSIRQTESDTKSDDVIRGANPINKTPESQKREATPAKVEVPRALSLDETYAEADTPLRESTYAQPDHPSAVTTTLQKQENKKDPYKYEIAKALAAKNSESPKNKYAYSKVNKSVRVKPDKNETSAAKEEPDMTIIDGNVYSPLKEGEYDHLHKKRAKTGDAQKGDNYQNIKMSSENIAKARTLDRKLFETHYATPPPVRANTLKAYPHSVEKQETYDVPLKPTPLKRGKMFGGSINSLDKSLITEETYDVPPSSDETYRVPPLAQLKKGSSQEYYDIPPTTDSIYRLPPSSRPLTVGDDVYAVPDDEDGNLHAEPNAESSPKKDSMYDKPPLIPTPFADIYNVPKSQSTKQKVVGGLVYEDV